VKKRIGLESTYKLWNWYTTREKKKLTQLEGKLLEIKIRIDHYNTGADTGLSVHLGTASSRKTTKSDSKNYVKLVLRNAKNMAKLGFTPFGMTENDGFRIVIKFLCRSESLRKRDEESVIRLLGRVCKALKVRFPNSLDTEHRYNFQ